MAKVASSDTVLKQMLIAALRAAQRAAADADPGPDGDGGTCNMDQVHCRFKGIPRKVVGAALAAAGEPIAFRPVGHWKGYFLNLGCKGQANRNTIMVEAAAACLKKHGLNAVIYYQID